MDKDLNESVALPTIQELYRNIIPFHLDNFITVPLNEEGEYKPQVNIFFFVDFSDYETWDDAYNIFTDRVAEVYLESEHCVYINWDTNSKKGFEISPDRVYLEFNITHNGDIYEIEPSRLYDIHGLLLTTNNLLDWLKEDRKTNGNERKTFYGSDN